MAKNTKGNLLMVVLRVKAPINGTTEESTKELFKMVSPKGKATFFFQTAGAIKVRLTMSSLMERGFSSGRMGANTLATLSMINWMELEASSGRMGDPTMEISIITN